MLQSRLLLNRIVLSSTPSTSSTSSSSSSFVFPPSLPTDVPNAIILQPIGRFAIPDELIVSHVSSGVVSDTWRDRSKSKIYASGRNKYIVNGALIFMSVWGIGNLVRLQYQARGGAPH